MAFDDYKLRLRRLVEWPMAVYTRLKYGQVCDDHKRTTGTNGASVTDVELRS